MLSFFKVASFKFNLIAQTAIYLPEYSGSAFRGAFGNVLYKTLCINKSAKTCDECMLNQRCVYTYIFNPIASNFSGVKDIPQPFVIEPPMEGSKEYKPSEEIELGLIIIGDAIRFLPYFIFVFSEVGKVGIGKGRGNYELQKVSLIKDGQSETIYTKKDGIVKNIEKLSFEFSYKPEDTNRVTLHFLSPVRMRYEGKLVFKPEFHHIVRSLLRRIYILSLFWHNFELKLNFSDLIRKSEKVVVREMDIKWFDWTRFSSRQNTKMKLGGFVGKITYEGELTEFMPFLRLGELIHIGKNCSFGLGKYKIV